MPPRTVKRGAAASAARRTPRVTKSSPKVVNKQPETEQEPMKKDEVTDPVVDLKDEVTGPVVDLKDEVTGPVVDLKDEDQVMEEAKVEEKSPVLEVEATGKSDANGDIRTKEEDEVKEPVEEYEKDERLELDDNEPEYEPEEDGGEDFDVKEMDQEEEMEDEDEELDGAEKEGSLSDEEVAEGEGDEDDEEAGDHEEHHKELTDAAEHEEHHDVVQERRKRKEFEVFVGGLDKDATEDDITKVFSQVGEVVEIRLMKNPQTKKNKGFAFLRFATVEQAKRAVTDFKSPLINGKQCGVTPSQDSDTLFLGNICKTWTKEALKEKLKHYGVENVEDLTLLEDTNNEGMNRGFAFLEFLSRSDAMDAFKRLQRRDVIFGVDRPAKVSFADSFIDPGDEIMAQVRTIFVDGPSPSWDEDYVKELLKKYGGIEKIELAKDMPAAGRKDYGFITFDSHDAAVNCAKSINNTVIGEGDNKAKVRARLSRPQNRGRPKLGRESFRSSRGSGRVAMRPWGRPPPRGFLSQGARRFGGRVPPSTVKRPIRSRVRRSIVEDPPRTRPVPHPRSYGRRGPVPPYPKSSLKREYGRHEEIPPPRSRLAPDYGPRVVQERLPEFRDEYPSRSSAYSDIARSTTRPVARRPYMDDGYGERFERPPPSYRENSGRNYDSIHGSKRPYSHMDDIPPRYADDSVRHPRARLDYELATSATQYGDAYGDRLGRSSLGYGGGRSALSNQDSHGLYSSRQSLSYRGGSYSSSSGYGGDYGPRGSDVGGSSYSSLYSSRSIGRSSYMGGGSGSYY